MCELCSDTAFGTGLLSALALRQEVSLVAASRSDWLPSKAAVVVVVW